MKKANFKLVITLFCMALMLPLIQNCGGDDGGGDVGKPGWTKDVEGKPLDPIDAGEIGTSMAMMDFSLIDLDNYIGIPGSTYNSNTDKWSGSDTEGGSTITAEWQYRTSSGMPRQFYDPPPYGDVTEFEITYKITGEEQGVSMTMSAHELFTNIYENDYFAYDFEGSGTMLAEYEREAIYMDIEIYNLKYDSRNCYSWPYEGTAVADVYIKGEGSATVTIDFYHPDGCDWASVKVTTGGDDYCYDYDLYDWILYSTPCE